MHFLLIVIHPRRVTVRTRVCEQSVRWPYDSPTTKVPKKIIISTCILLWRDLQRRSRHVKSQMKNIEKMLAIKILRCSKKFFLRSRAWNIVRWTNFNFKLNAKYAQLTVAVIMWDLINCACISFERWCYAIMLLAQIGGVQDANWMFLPFIFLSPPPISTTPPFLRGLEVSPFVRWLMIRSANWFFVFLPNKKTIVPSI